MELGTGAQPVVRMRARSKVFNLPLRLAQLSLQPPPQPENQQKLPAVQEVREEHEEMREKESQIPQKEEAPIPVEEGEIPEMTELQSSPIAEPA